jgi:S1-C subfamily serine protease
VVAKHLIGLAAVALVSLVTARADALDVPKLAAEARPSVVLINLYDARGNAFGSGSGFFVSLDGKVVTNHHVIEDAARAVAVLSDGRELPVQGVLADDTEHDIAIVQVDGAGVPPLVLGDTEALHPGDDVVVIGSPLGLSSTVSSGIVAAVRSDGLTKERGFGDETRQEMGNWGLQITAPVSHGSSGSPILDERGQVVGVAVGVLNGGQNLNFGVPTRFVKVQLAKASVSPTPKPLEDRSYVKRNLAISAGLAIAAVLAYLLTARIVAARARRRRVREKAARVPRDWRA